MVLKHKTRNYFKHESLIEHLTGDNKPPDPSVLSVSSTGFRETMSLCIDSCKGPFVVAEVGGLCVTDSKLSDILPLQECTLWLLLSLLGDPFGLPWGGTTQWVGVVLLVGVAHSVGMFWVPSCEDKCCGLSFFGDDVPLAASWVASGSWRETPHYTPLFRSQFEAMLTVTCRTLTSARIQHLSPVLGYLFMYVSLLTELTVHAIIMLQEWLPS